MKRFFTLFLLLFFVFGNIVPLSSSFAHESSEEDENTYFVVTAYYSPLPNQEHYLTGNYEDEIILNGKGIAGASGKKVFSGMLAAPGKYSFGTKIYLDGLGIGEVSDRGGAIVPAGQRGYTHDRIDVWMGYGDEGLRRAMFWGKREVYGYIVDSGNTPTLSYDSIPSPNWATQGLKVGETLAPVSDIFDISLMEGSDTTRITELQNILVELGYLEKDDVNGLYDAATISAIYDFQIKASILVSEKDIGAGVYGPKTRKELEKLYTVYNKEKQEKENFEAQIAPLRETSFSQAEKHVSSLEKPEFGEISPRVRELQKTLEKLGYFPHKDTAIFGVKTQNALLEYQNKKELISTPNDLGAGTFGPQTRAQFTKDLAEIYFQELLEKEKLTQQYKKYYENEHIISVQEAPKVSLSDISTKI